MSTKDTAKAEEALRRIRLDSFEDNHAIELLLFFAVPRKDTNALLMPLIDRLEAWTWSLRHPRRSS
jgi:hypothetical protein